MIKKINIALFILASMAFSESYKEPEYTLLEKHGSIEIRKYSEYVIAKTSIDRGSMELNNNMFRVLASYIFGGNSKNESIPMTAPVITDENDSSYNMIFFMLDVNTPDELPQPNNQNIKIETMNIGKTISITFGMWATKDRIERNKQKLDKYIRKNHIQVNSTLMVAQYNSPWTIPPFRKNELIYKVK